MKVRYNFFLLFVISLSACITGKQAGGDLQKTDESFATVEVDQNLTEEEAPDSAVIIRPDELPVYQATAARTWDLIHTRLQLAFDWEKQRVMGTASLSLRPYFYKDSTLTLDAQFFDIHYIVNQKSGDTLRYDYDEKVLQVFLNQTYSRTDTLNLTISYTAKPAERGQAFRGGAITSDQGLFFINHDGGIQGKPQQIWTQGQTQYNSCWFPTIDHPNERCTGEIILTVEDRFVTLSNGLLMSSNKTAGGMRTDHWVMDKPHPPYLFMIAVGEYAVVREKWKTLDLAYYVEPAYRTSAQAIFAHTPEMLTFFSEKFGVEYPWQKYHQVIVRDYVSGAMENTTAVIFGDFVQRTKRQLLEDNNDKIVAHELAHHWFGNYITCESWANLTLNEGFANYAEYLWLEHKYGRSEADLHRAQELSGYLNETLESPPKNLIRFDYENKEEMFDAHSYNKGGLVLHMLRDYLGDEAFFEGVKRFLTENAWQAVEAHHLRLAMEAVSGQDLNWFFNQWFFDKGHPVLELDFTQDKETGKAYISIVQTQDLATHRSLFDIPTRIDLFLSSGKTRSIPVRINKAFQVVEVIESEEILDVLLDPDFILLGEIQYNQEKSVSALKSRFYNSSSDFYKFESMAVLQEKSQGDEGSFFREALNHPFWLIRAMAIENLDEDFSEQTLWNMALADPSPVVRSQALNRLSFVAENTQMAIDNAMKVINKEDNETGENAGIAFTIWASREPETASAYLWTVLEKEVDPSVILSMLDYLVQTEQDIPLNTFADKLKHFDGYEAISFSSLLYAGMASAPQADQEELINRMHVFARDFDSKPVQRYAYMQLLGNMILESENKLVEDGPDFLEENQENLEKLLRRFSEIKNKETNLQVLAAYEYLR
jgi:aminopeptidase N